MNPNPVEVQMQKPTMTTEPIRLPAWIGSLMALVVLPALAATLTGVNWRTVLLGVIAALIPLLTGVEIKRGLTDSPATAALKAPTVLTGISLKPGPAPAPEPVVGITTQDGFEAALADLRGGAAADTPGALAADLDHGLRA